MGSSIAVWYPTALWGQGRGMEKRKEEGEGMEKDSPSSSVVIFTPQSSIPSRAFWLLIMGKSSLTFSCSFSSLKLQESAYKEYSND